MAIYPVSITLDVAFLTKPYRYSRSSIILTDERADGTTAAQRLFDHPFPDLFEWVVDHMGDLPLARKSSKAHQPNPLPTLLFPA